MRASIVHLSDLHFIPDWPEGNDLVLDQLVKDLRTQLQGAYSPLLAFSGDFVKGGADTLAFEAAFKKLDAAFNDLGIPRDARIVVPGNHDVSQSAIRSSLLIQKGALNEIRTEEDFNDSLPQLGSSFFNGKLANYRLFEKQFARLSCCQTSIGGAGWNHQDSLGIYCLNSALCSFGGVKDSSGTVISDRKRLMIDTRSLYRWLAENKSNFRILLMHHPLDWLSEWSQAELEKIISQSFNLVLCGHVHTAIPQHCTRGAGATVSVVAPPLFTRKSELLGYSIVEIDTDTKQIEISYRQWAQTNNFVTGTSLSGNDVGRISFAAGGERIFAVSTLVRPTKGTTLEILQQELREASLLYSSKPDLWVDRDLAGVSETSEASASTTVLSQSDFAKRPASCIIRAPAQFGLTCLGKRIAVEHNISNGGTRALVTIDANKCPDSANALSEHIEQRCGELMVSRLQVAGIVVDNWQSTRRGRRILNCLNTLFPSVALIALHDVDDGARIADSFATGEDDFVDKIPTFYLWSLSRNRIRQLVHLYVEGSRGLDDEQVTKRVVGDIDTLNIPRTPHNCLLLLKLAEQAFDDSPVNRTEVISRVLSMLFFQFDKIPTYATRPDLKDCEYALGFFCEGLIREHKTQFSKKEFYQGVSKYCEQQLIELDVDVLFVFLVEENILVKRSDEFAFRFTYWLYYFAAHRMHHSVQFAEYMLKERRYSAYPELMEFYTGIDRRRTDAISQLTCDLKALDAEFLQRTGITTDFNPFKEIHWALTQETAEILEREIKEEIAGSSAPAAVKDAIADGGYNRAKPYKQELAQFLSESSLEQMVQAMRGASRALRNSDHVAPDAKAELLKEVITCWKRVCQIVAVLSPLLAKSRFATFEGISFYLDKSFDPIDGEEKRWHALIVSIATNVVDWYQEEIFSKKMGPLFVNHIERFQGEIDELLLLLVLVRQRPPKWEKEIERFVIRANKNSFYLSRVYGTLRAEFKFGSTTEKCRQSLRRLAAMSVAKHQTGAKHPDAKLIERAAQQVLEEKSPEARAKQGRSAFF